MPDVFGLFRWVFLPNYLIKLVVWIVYIYKPRQEDSHCDVPAWCNDYFCLSDVVIFVLFMVVHYIREFCGFTESSISSNLTDSEVMDQKLMVW